MWEVLTPRCVSMPRNTRVCYIRADTGDVQVDTLLPGFPEYGDPSRDLLLVNFGLHHGTTSYKVRVWGCGGWAEGRSWGYVCAS